MNGTQSFSPRNNLNWVRLLLAAQVMLEHVAVHLHGWTFWLLGCFPGVPAFFFVSGFLIYSAYRNSPGRQYVINRFLRLFPALLFVTLGGLAILLYAHGPADIVRHPATYAGWLVAQLTIGQWFNPGLFRDVGVGVINGSLWTITTEILFYATVPLVVAAERRFATLPVVPVLSVLSFAVYAIGPQLSHRPVYHDKTIFDMLAMTPIVWGWMFGAGILTVKHFGALRRWFPFLPVAALAAVPMILYGSGILFNASGNRLGLVYFLVYAALVVWVAFATPYVPLKTDLSYGLYIWHMPIINLFLVLGVIRPWLALATVVAAALVSWFAIERPALRLKKVSLLAPRTAARVAAW